MSVQKTDLNLFRRLRPAEVCDAGLVRWAGGRLRRFVQSQSAEGCDAGPAFWEGESTMSFAGDVKTELCRGKLGDKGAAQAEACGVLLYCNRFTLDQVKIVTESPAFAKRLPGLFRKAFGLTFDEKGDPGTPGKRIFTIGDRAKLALLWEVCAFDPSDPAHHINFGLLEDGPCRVAFLRGAFLAGGSVTDPQKGYHLELATTHLRVSRELHTLLLELGYTPKETTRKANYITYFKQSEAIEDFLTAIGAPIAAMELMNAKAEKLLRNGVNRRVNCEAANVDKTVDAALEQRQAIQTLREAGTLDTLSPKLREAAALREAHPELSLAQLAALCDPPVTKSSLSHRLRKLIQLSQSGAGEGGV